MLTEFANLLTRKNAALILAKLYREGPMSMGEFEAASEVTAGPAATLRKHLEFLGLVETEESAERGAKVRKQVRLTPFGESVASHLAAAMDAYDRGPGKRKGR